MNLCESIPYAREIKHAVTSPFHFKKAVFIRIKNKSGGDISYTFGSAKITLEPGEEDTYPSFPSFMTGQITFSFPSGSAPFNIKFYKIELIDEESK